MPLHFAHTSTESCAPLCASIGHTFVTLTVWRCEHHGALSGVLTTYTEAATGLTDVVEREWVSGPFTADLDLEQLVGWIRASLEELRPV